MQPYEPPEVRAAAARAQKPRPIEPAGDTIRPVRIYHEELDKQAKEISALFENADDITIFGMAGPALISALDGFAVRVAKSEHGSLPWKRLRYITPEPSVALANRGDLGLGPVVRAWQSALEAVRNCIRQDLRADQAVGPSVMDQVELSATPMMYQETIFRVIKRERTEIWTAVGPHATLSTADAIGGIALKRSDAPYLVLHHEHPLYRHLDSLLEGFIASAKPYPLRQVTCPRIAGEELQRLTTGDGAEALDRFETLLVDGLRLFAHDNSNLAACLPIAAVVVRSMTARGPVVVLQLRDKGLDSDSFERLSLLTGRIYEEDLASSLGVSPFFDRDADSALEEMWRAADIDGPLCVSTKSFVRAAQREIYSSFGLDIPPNRFRLHGLQALEHASGDQNCFAVFELILDPKSELEIATADRKRFQQVRQAELYTDKYRNRLNHLLDERRDWLVATMFSQPITRSR